MSAAAARGPRLHVVAGDELAGAAAAHLAALGRACLADRGRFVLALSGGATPGPMCRALSLHELDWSRTSIVQVDERIAPAGHADRNLGMIRDAVAGTPAEAATLLPMPVEELLRDGDDGGRGADEARTAAVCRRYADVLRGVAGDPVRIDAVQLGIGEDGHTASLVPGDPVLGITDVDVAVTRAPYQGRRRMTLTYPCLDRARHLMWLVAEGGKADALRGLLAGDPALPASHVRRDATVYADADAAGG